MATELMNVTTLGDDTIQAGQNMLLTFTNIGKDVFPQATKTLLDMSYAMNGGATPSAEALSSQAIQLGKALNDPTKGMTALSRVGVTFTETQKETIKTMQETGDIAGAQQVILAELAKEFGGSAAAAAETFSGRMEQAKVKIGEIGETIGGALMPALSDMSGGLGTIIDDVANWVTANQGNIAQMAVDIQNTFGAVWDTVSGMVSDVYSFFVEMYTALTGDTQKTGQSMFDTFHTLFQSIVIGFDFVALGARNLVEGVVLAFNFIKSAVRVAGESVAGGMVMLVAAALAPIQEAINGVIKGFNWLSEQMGGTAVGLVSFADDLGQKVKAKLVESWTDAGDDISKSWAEFQQNTTTNTANALAKMDAHVGAFNQKVVIGESFKQTAIGKTGKYIAEAGDQAEKSAKKAEDAAKKHEAAIKKLEDTAKSTYASLTSSINTHAGKVESLKQQYDDLQKKIIETAERGKKEIESLTLKLEDQNKKIQEIVDSGTKEIGARAIEITKEMAEIQKQFAASTDEQEKKDLIARQDKLAAELKLAQATAGTAGIAAAKAESEKNETQKIIEKTMKAQTAAEQERLDILKTLEEKKKSIDAETLKLVEQSNRKKLELKKEQDLYASLLTERTALDNAYFDSFGARLADQQSKIQTTITMIQQLNALSGGGGASGGGIAGARAEGGPVNSGETYLVGEKGPELFTPSKSGQIIPNGGSVPNITINMGGVNVRNDGDIRSLTDSIAKELARKLQLFKQGVA